LSVEAVAAIHKSFLPILRAESPLGNGLSINFP
jgi:hypothetical protein